MATNQGCKGLIPSRLIDHKFLYYYLSSISDLLNDLGTGATFRELSGGKLKEVTVPFPSLPEQQRIVAILDEAFAAIATAKANAEKNLKNAQDLLKGHLNDLFCHREVEWVEKRLGDISRISYGFTESASFEKIGPQFLRITDISDSGVDWGTVPYCPIDASVLSKYRLVEGDIVFARTGATTGKSYLVSNPPESVFASYLIRVQLRDKELMPQFLNLFFQTKQYWDTIYAGVSGSAQGGFNAKKLGDLLIPFPKSSKEQMTIVAQFDKLTAEVQRFARLYERKLSSLEMLKKSLLHRAFNGQLTAQVTDRAFAEAAL